MKRTVLLCLAMACSLMYLKGYSQVTYENAMTENLGWPSMPLDSDPIAPLENYGELNDFSGGYNIGDTVADFTVYDFLGHSLTLSEQLTGDKPVIIMSSSVSCIRFRNLFDTTIETQETTAARTFINEHIDDFNWIFIYNLEAHPSDGNCPSNCPTTETLDSAVTQGPDYGYRRYSMHDWETHGSPYDFPFTMYADNPDNGIYNNYFRRAFGIVVLSCEGVVLQRGDWANQFITFQSDFLTSLTTQTYQQCEVIEEEEEEEDLVGEEMGIEEEEGEEVVGITSNIEDTFVVYPNPFENNLQLNGLNGAGTIQLYGSMGQLIWNKNINDLSVAIDTSDLQKGVYTLSVSTNGNVYHSRIVKK